MSDYISREAAIDATMQYCPDDDGTCSKADKDIRELLADVAPVVRCRDCEAWQTAWNPSIPDRHYCAVMDSMMKADDFCSYGERKE